MTDYNKLVEALRCKRDDCEGCDLAFFDNDEGWMCQYAAKDDDAAAAIEDLQAEVEKWTYNATLEQSKAIANFESYCKLKEQMPKRGEWIVKGANRIDCSVCGHSICFARVLSKESLTGYKYCPNCGAKMEVQDGQ